ncbi:DUF2243 domain-containing protein [Rhodocytophaga aerolata]|uniref:DUF2243 domain-containing protein n=1 Tax=Rhodocytophaga aerolata TaxID=455078 RepID=A0ABT8RA33_9BACT|nr:DUF2243 domain-containing protein [Rhodocytophaga aerolata]MDO1448956.1 DUF2243 domain-containing protein [Rhodocytophaga aerolata]
MKKLLLLLIGLCFHLPGIACVTCNKQIQETIFDSTFYPNLVTMLSAFIVLGLLVALLAFVSTRRHRLQVAANPSGNILNPVPLTSAATVLGIGLGGFIDGIVLHQILQWHEMLSNKLPPTTLVTKSVNMFWDGIFHAFTLLVVGVGIVLLWRLLFRKDISRSGNLLAGGILLGWGLFNIVEGIIDHHLLKLHNVREITENTAAWNYGFLGLSLLLIIAGLALTGRERKVESLG